MLVETAIAFPIQMLITLAIMQFCLIAVGKQVVNYAANAAAINQTGTDQRLASRMASSSREGLPPPLIAPGGGTDTRGR